MLKFKFHSQKTHTEGASHECNDTPPLACIKGAENSAGVSRAYGNLDGVLSTSLLPPQSQEQEERVVQGFLSGLQKLFTKENNWPFLRPLLTSMEFCAKCQGCSEACPVFLGSGRNELYRPASRSEMFRGLVKRHVKPYRWLPKLGTGIHLNWETLVRLYELAYRCCLCRRCAQFCPLGVDNALIAREIRKLFSQELGWAPKEFHENGTFLRMARGSSTGMTPKALRDILDFLDEEASEKLGAQVKTPLDKPGADILLVHNAGEFLSWPDNPEAYSILFNAAGLDWTLSSGAYDISNYGLFYDDIQFARIGFKAMESAKNLKVKRIVVGECGHAHKAFLSTADRLFMGDLNIPRISALSLLESVVFSGRVKFLPHKNAFPVTLHDPCNIVRNLGIFEPQRNILRYLCPDFREMTPSGMNNFCCGGGGGLSMLSSRGFLDWRVQVSGKMKLEQILHVFKDCLDTKTKKYVCAPCSNCKRQLNDLFDYYKLTEKYGIVCGGIGELVVNAMACLKKPFLFQEQEEIGLI